MIVPVILSGGEGKRLWPMSSAARPKQSEAGELKESAVAPVQP